MPNETAARKKSVPCIKRCREKSRRRDGQKAVGRIKRRRWKCRKVAHLLAARCTVQVALRSWRAVRNSRRYDAHGLRVCASALLSRSRHKRCYLQSRLMRRCPLAQNLAAHESPPSPRVTRARRPGSLKITSSCVRRGDGAVTRLLSTSLVARPAGQSARQLVEHPSRPPLLRRCSRK